MGVVRRIRRNRRRRVFFDFPDCYIEHLKEKVYNENRYHPHAILFNTAEIQNTLQSDTCWNQSLQTLLQVVIVFRFAATGAHQN